MALTIKKAGAAAPKPPAKKKKGKGPGKPARPEPLTVSIPEPAPGAPLEYRSTAFKRIFDLGTERVAALDAMLLRGDGPAAVARWLQGELQLFTDLKENTLIQQLDRYHKIHVMPRVAQNVKRQEKALAKAGERTRHAAAAVFQRLDVQTDLEWLAKVQRARIEKLLQREAGMAMPLDALTKLLGPYQNTLNKIADLQLETGTIRRAPKIVHAALDLTGEGKEVPQFMLDFDERAQERKGVALLLQALREGANDVIEGDYTNVTDEPVDPANP